VLRPERSSSHSQGGLVDASLKTRLTAVSLALLTLAAVIFAALNFHQRERFTLPDDGVSWMDSAQGVRAWHVEPDSPAAQAGLREGDILKAIGATPIARATEVTRLLYRAGTWSELNYQLERRGQTFTTAVVTAPMHKPLSFENYLRVVGLLYLGIGLFIFARRWHAPRAVHFYLFCLVSFILYSFHYSGKPGAFDAEVRWANVVALLLQPALLAHFALVFPERHPRPRLKVWLLYLLPAALLALHLAVATGSLGFTPWLGARIALDQIEMGYLGVYLLLAAGIFLASFRRAPSGIVRQQLKWATGGTLAGIFPFFFLYIVPFFFGVVPRPWMNFSTLSLVLVPLSFGYAIVRYRLMDVDIIFKRGLAYTAATAGVVAVYFAVVAVIGELFHAAWPTGLGGAVLAIVAAAFLFQPLRDWVQERLDRFFYRDRLNYRRTLVEFGRTLATEVHLEPMLSSVLHRISQALLVDRLAIFLEDPEAPGRFRMTRSTGLHWSEPLDLTFLSSARLQSPRGYLFFESPAAAPGTSESARETLEQLGLNYFIACHVHDRTVAVLGLGRTVDGDYLTSDDLDLLFTMAGYVAIALENAALYRSLEQKAEQVARLKDYNENIVESLSVGVLAADLDGRVESWNNHLERRFGLTRAQALGRRLDEVLPPELVAEIEAHSADLRPPEGLPTAAGRQSLASSEDFGSHAADRVANLYKLAVRARSGAVLTLNVAVAPLVGKTGEKLGRLILVDDITDRVSFEQQLMQAEKLTSLGLLAAGVAHEVNTPLAVISNYIQMLAKQLPATDPRQALIDKIVKQTFRASEIVNHLLNFSRTGTAEFAEVDLNAVIEETLGLVTHPFRTARISVIKSLAGDLPAILGSTNRLQQVFLNLFLNARDAMPNGGMVEVRTGSSNGTVEVEVTDTGVGITTEHLHRIFDPFFTTKSSGRGTGLGLAVSYGIIKEHAGRVDVHSTPGKGTSFRLEFPTARLSAGADKAVHA
jgi:two-component system, NtrC family, sensor kinase